MIDTSRDWSGEDVAALLEKHGLSQRGLAALLGTEPKTVNKWILGKAAPSRLSSVALTYTALDLDGRLAIVAKAKGKRGR